jgi:hypothetical protein
MHDLTEITCPGWLDEYMEMIWQENVSQQGEWVEFLDLSKGRSEQIHTTGILEDRAAILNHLRDEYGRAKNVISMEIHGNSFIVGYAYSVTLTTMVMLKA